RDGTLARLRQRAAAAGPGHALPIRASLFPRRRGAKSMKRERGKVGTAPGRCDDTSWERRVRTLFDTAYPPLNPTVEPSEGLQQRVSAGITRREEGRMRQGWLGLVVWWEGAVGAG